VARRSIGLPLTIGVTLCVVAAALLVGWQVLVVQDLGSARGLTALQWTFIILGSVFFLLLITGLVLLCAWLVREMRHNQRQQAFLDAVTHEMKTPLASMRLYVETLERRDPAPERRQAFLRRMGEDVVRLEHTVDQVLAAARAEVRPAQRGGEAVELRALLGECIAELRARHGLPEQAVRLEAPEAALAWGDAAELAVVFRNLVENAVKYSEPPVDVRVILEAESDGRIGVEIRDRGIGIEPRELRKIFQRFYRAGRDVQRQAAGLGLGLFIVRNLVRRQGGRVEARSEGSGRGSRFRVSLRAASESAPRSATLPAAASSATASPRAANAAPAAGEAGRAG
jgi:signal transduction histidine kinase